MGSVLPPWYFKKSRPWEVLGGERAPGSESFQKETSRGLWPSLLTLFVNLTVPALESPLCQRRGAMSTGCDRCFSAPQPCPLHCGLLPTLWTSLILFLPLFILFLPLSTQELVAESGWPPSGAHSPGPRAVPHPSRILRVLELRRETF